MDISKNQYRSTGGLTLEIANLEETQKMDFLEVPAVIYRLLHFKVPIY